MIKDIINQAHSDNRLFIRSTLQGGYSHHAWIDSTKHWNWPLPTDTKPGQWRSPQTSVIAAHEGGMHAAKFHAYSYWIGEETYLFESAPNATLNPRDDVVASSQARLIQKIETPDTIWFNFACKCLEKILEFPEFYDYTDNFGSSAERGPIHPALKNHFQQTKSNFDFKTSFNLIKKRYRNNEELSQEDFNFLQGHTIQAYAHTISHGREARFDIHNEAISSALKALGMARDFFNPRKNAFSTAQEILKLTATAYEAAGREQQILMIKKGYGIENGLGPLLRNLPYLPHEATSITEFGRIARRGFMLSINQGLLHLLNLGQLDNLQSLTNGQTVGDVLDQTAPLLKQIEKPNKKQGNSND